jgi:hypothetical protein
MMFVKRYEHCLFVISPFTFLKFRIQMVDESFPALLSLSPRQMRSNLGPLSAVELSFVAQNIVLFSSP